MTSRETTSFSNCAAIKRLPEPHRTLGVGEGSRALFGVVAWLPMLVLPALVPCFRESVEPWIFMWIMAGAMFVGCKWLTWCRARKAGVHAWQNWAYLLAWPGLDAEAFLDGTVRVSKPGLASWIGASLKTAFGMTVVWQIVRWIPESQAPVRGWVGLVGCVFILHFGLFHLLALAWQAVGVNAQPLMRAPILATSLGEFWGRRWNSAFNCLVHDSIFRPLHRRIGVATSTLAVFLASGLIHELVISFPARAGYGWPTLYFLIQGVGLLFERSRGGRLLGLRRGLVGRFYTVALTAIPAFCLFHPPFIRNVILPMLQVIGATTN